MSPLHSASILLAIAALSSWLNHRYLKLPSAIGIMTLSLLFSLFNFLFAWLGWFDISLATSIVEGFDFQKIVLNGMLAFLLFAGAMTVDLNELRSQRAFVAILATFGVILSTFITGFLFWKLLGFVGISIPFVTALLFGAISSPTDPVAVLGILRKVGVPKSLEVKIVGESLFNDGVGVVIFFAVLSFASGIHPTAGEVLQSLAVELAGGIFLAIALGWITYEMVKVIDDYVVEVLLTLSLAAGGYSLAEVLHVSAPIFAVVAGLIIGNHGRASAMSAKTREHLDTFWELIDELLNAILFVLIGLEVLVLSIKHSYLLAGVLGIAAVLAGRLVSVWIPILMLQRWKSFTPHAVKILTWGGLRGGISVALALSLPPGGSQDLLVISIYVVVLFSVLVQGSTLPILLRYARKRGEMTT